MLEAPGASSPLAFAWERRAVKGDGGWIADVATHRRGVLLVGAESTRRGHAEPFVASFADDGRELYRATLGEPRSTTTPSRAVAVAAAAAPNGDAYVVATAARIDAPPAVQLTLLDAEGKQRFSSPLELSGQAEPKLAVDAAGDAVVAGMPASGRALVIAKYAPDGARRWAQTFDYSGDVPRVAAVGSRIVLVASFHGSARFGSHAVQHTGTQPYRCGSDPAQCERPSRALLVVELDGDGTAARARILGSSSAVIQISDLAPLPGGGLVVSGEFSGARAELGAVSACELEPGLPEPEPVVFRERADVTTQRCVCRNERRDLFVAELGAGGEPVWWKTLALGEPDARLAAAHDGPMLWGARLSDTSTGGGESTASVWTLDDSGTVRSRHTTSAPVRELSVGASGAYVSDAHTLRRISWGR